MTQLLTGAQMRRVEQAAIASGDTTGLDLMERAGCGVVDAIFAQWPELARRGASPSRSPRYLEKDESQLRAVILCGPGNNGGDGFVVARLLQDAGWVVEVYLYGGAERLPPDARVNFLRWSEMGAVGMLGSGAQTEAFMRKVVAFGPEVIVDALFGTGLTRPLEGEVQDLVAGCLQRQTALTLSGRAPKIVSVDVSSGLCADSGRSLPHAVCADLTVTFQTAKCGHYLAEGPYASGRLRRVDIGLGSGGAVSRNAGLEPNQPCDEAVSLVAADRVRFVKDGRAHKFDHGHALILCGGPGHTGAARLAARGALRIGAGMVTLAVPPSAQMEVASQITAVMLRRVSAEGGASDGLAAILQDARINALCLGPGLGVARAAALLPVALASGRPCVLDADALSALAQDAEMFGLLHKDCVLTPHAGEFARLFPDIAEKLAAVPSKGPAVSKVDATRAAAQRAGCVVLFKGPDTVIADPEGQCAISAACYDRAAPWLATAGSGDVLAGYITGLLARGAAPMRAAEAAAWLHVECALHFGPGLIAEDIPEQIPAVFRALGV
jgi:hydroxyethylthiazole kinase-like uncharacterized protein yjeF